MTPRARKKIVAWTVALAVVAGGGLAAHRLVADAGADTPPFRTQPVARERIVATVTASGTLSPLKTVLVGSQVSGTVLELHADFNTVVSKGDVIARIDPRLFQSELARAQANLASARAGLVRADAALGEARSQHARTKTLVERGILPAAEGDTASAAAKSAAASRTAALADVEQARAAVEQAKTNLALTTIVSPIDGVVISRDVDVGQTVAASLSAPTLFTIAEDMRAMEVHTSVAESDVGVLADGMAVTFTVDAHPGERFRGEVTQIRNAATTVQSVVTYDAVVRVDNPELKLRPGMTANVTFVVAERRGALAVPAAALRFSPEAAPARARRGARLVWVLEGVTPRAVEVETGVTDGRMTEITGGELPEGALVITGRTGDAPAQAARPQQQARGGGMGGGRRGGLGL
jgi:HlyD family secretion protein